MELFAGPPERVDERARRAIAKELRAALGTGRAQWSDQPLGPPKDGLTLLTRGDAPAVELAIADRIGLAHLFVGLRTHFPDWPLLLIATGTDGDLRLSWATSADDQSIAASLLGIPPDDDESKSYWEKHDGGLTALSPGRWLWDPVARRWTPGD